MVAIKLAIIGAGRIGRLHASSLKQLALELAIQVTWVADVSEDAARSLAEAIGSANWTTNIESVFLSDVDAVIVAASTAVHSECLRLAAQYHKHIFCEKPGGLNTESLLASKQALDEAGVKVCIGFQRRFDRDVLEIVAKRDRGEIGDVFTATLNHRDPVFQGIAYLGTAGGLFKDLGIHDFDLIHLLMPFPIKSVHTLGRSNIPDLAAVGQTDTAGIIIEHQGNRWSYLSFSREAHFAYDQRLELLGTKGGLVSKLHPVNAVEICSSEGLVLDPHYSTDMPAFIYRHRLSYERELRSFIKQLLDEPGPRGASIDDALNAMVLADAAMESLARGARIDFEAFKAEKLGKTS
jgi:myo-inositol 2-dehydrogenase/D-chiro-inositol 1-dehydrogenase